MLRLSTSSMDNLGFGHRTAWGTHSKFLEAMPKGHTITIYRTFSLDTLGQLTIGLWTCAVYLTLGLIKGHETLSVYMWTYGTFNHIAGCNISRLRHCYKLQLYGSNILDLWLDSQPI